MNIKIEKKTGLIEENSLYSLAPTNSINVVLEEKIKEEEKEVVQPSNMSPNTFKSHWRPVSHKNFLPSDKRPFDLNSFKNNHKNRLMKDESPAQPRFIVPQSAP